MILKLYLNNHKPLDIQLIDNQFVNDWANHIITLDLLPTEHTSLACPSQGNEKIFNQKLKELLKGLNKIPKILNTSIPIEFKTQLDLYDYNDIYGTQHQMNIIHRWVVSTSHGVKYTIDNCDAILTVKKDPSILAYNGLIWQLNKLVHEVEQTYNRPRYSKYLSNLYWDQDFKFKNHVDSRFIWNKKYDHLFTTKNHDMWLAKRILGKDYRESWLDNDNPTEFDVTNTDPNVGWAFELDPLNDTESFFKSTEFNDWLNMYDINNNDATLGRVPLGNIINKNDISNIMLNNQIIKLELYE